MAEEHLGQKIYWASIGIGLFFLMVSVGCSFVLGQVLAPSCEISFHAAGTASNFSAPALNLTTTGAATGEVNGTIKMPCQWLSNLR